jgi:hypothetical protein
LSESTADLRQVVRGQTYRRRIQWLSAPDSEGVRSPMPVTSEWSVKIQFRSRRGAPGDPLVELVTTFDADDASFELELDETQTRALSIPCVWGIELTKPDGEKVPFLSGRVYVEKELVV